MPKLEQQSYRSRMDDLRELQTFVALVEERSFSGAARRLTVVPSTVTKHIMAFEGRFAHPIIDRCSRQIELTEFGVEVYKHSKAIVGQIHALERDLVETNGVNQVELKITVPTGFAVDHMSRILSRFIQRYPGIMLDIRATNETLDLISNGFDAAVRLSTHLDLGLVAVKLAANPAVFCAAPSYINEHGMPTIPQDLLDHNCIVTRGFYGGRWPMMTEEGKIEHLAVRGNFMTNDGAMLRQALLSGLGVGYIARFQIQDDLRHGRLIELFPGQDASTSQIYVVYPEQRKTPQKTRVFVNYLREAFRSSTIWQ